MTEKAGGLDLRLFSSVLTRLALKHLSNSRSADVFESVRPILRNTVDCFLRAPSGGASDWSSFRDAFNKEKVAMPIEQAVLPKTGAENRDSLNAMIAAGTVSGFLGMMENLLANPIDLASV